MQLASQPPTKPLTLVRASVTARQDTLLWLTLPCGYPPALETHEVFFGEGKQIAITTTIKDVIDPT